MLEQKRKWTCDLCDEEQIVANGYPLGWECNAEVTCRSRKASADFCANCFQRAFPGHSEQMKDVAKGEYKRPWWKRFFGVEEKHG